VTVYKLSSPSLRKPVERGLRKQPSSNHVQRHRVHDEQAQVKRWQMVAGLTLGHNRGGSTPRPALASLGDDDGPDPIRRHGEVPEQHYRDQRLGLGRVRLSGQLSDCRGISPSPATFIANQGYPLSHLLGEPHAGPDAGSVDAEPCVFLSSEGDERYRIPSWSISEFASFKSARGGGCAADRHRNRGNSNAIT